MRPRYADTLTGSSKGGDGRTTRPSCSVTHLLTAHNSRCSWCVDATPGARIAGAQDSGFQRVR